MTKPVLPDKFYKIECPKCGAEMVKRNGRYGEFYGCSTYPKCNGTRSVAEAKRLVEAAKAGSKPKREFVPSRFQMAVFDAIENQTGNYAVQADAGSGKTETIVQGMKRTPKGASVLFCAFNRSIVNELRVRCPKGADIATFHSIGLRSLKKHLPLKPEVDNNKVWNICKELLPDNEDYALRVPLRKLVSLAKATLVDITDKAAVENMAIRYEVELNGDSERLIGLLPAAMTLCKERLHVVDYDDMIWLPVILDLPIAQYDIVFIDEFQDLNLAQIHLAQKLVNGTGRIIAVGDPKQSIYGFRGADTRAMARFIEELDAKTLELSISYRNPKSHLEFVRAEFPNVKTEAAEWAKEGIIRNVTYYQFHSEAKPGDLILCRVNAPLVKACYSFIRQGRKAVIRGRNIGEMLNNMVDRLMKDLPPNRQDIPNLLMSLANYKHVQGVKLEAAGKEEMIASLYDRCDTLEALCDGVRDLTELRHKISSIFDDVTREAIALSSIHRAKGTEAERVFILKPELMPHPLANAAWQLEQEENIKYVAYTRSKDELIFVE